MGEVLDRVEEELGQRVDELSDRVSMAKVHLIGRDEVAPSNVQSTEQGVRESNIFHKTGAILPPYEPATMCKLHEHSSALRQNVDAYAVNIDGFGHTFEPIIDLDAEDAEEKVSDAIYFERLAEAGESGEGDVEFPTDEEVEERMELMVNEMRLEHAKLTSLFEFCCLEESFITLRTKTRQDKEIMGNGFWEILRNGAGQPVQFTYVPGFTVRLMPLDKGLTEVDMKIKRAPLTFDTVKAFRRFRKYVQIHEGRKTFFKEFGDPRVVSARTGAVFKDDDALQAEENTDGDEKTKAIQATEMIHFAVHSPRSPYGVPRWVGALLSVLGIRQSEEVNFLYFENKSVPPLAVLVSGGRLTSDSVKKIEDFVETRIKGRKNFHSIMIIEAEAAAGAALDNASSRMRIEIKPLTDAQQKDGLFLNYDERGMDKVGMAFRLPRLLRGDVRDFNRACYDEQTETLTLKGWKRLGEFGLDDRVAAYDPENDRIEFVKPDALHVYDVDEELLHFQSGVADIMVTEDHTMLARGSMQDGRFTVHRSQSIPWSRYSLKTVAGGAGGSRLLGFPLPKSEGCKIERGHDHVSMVDGDTFIAFLGYWLSEGSLLSTDHPSAPYIVTLSQKDGSVADAIHACLKGTGWAFSESREEFSGMRRWSLSNRCLSAWLRENCGGGATEKRVPNLARDLCPEQLRILFDALMAGDGHWDSRPNRTSGFYPSISRSLCDDMQAIAIRLGYRASLALHYPSRGNRHTCWRVGISEGRDAEFRSEPRRVHYQGRVYCFSVPKHGFFVTRRNGKVAIQGNTADAALDFTEAQVFAPERGDFDWLMNRKILAELEIRFHTFVSNSPASRNPIDLAKIVVSLVDASVLTPEEARELAKSIFNRDFKKIDDLWTKIPPQLLMKGILPDDAGGAGALLGDGEEGDEGEEDEDVDPEMDELEGQLNALNKDITTGDLEEQGGAKVPAQGLPRRRGKKPKKKKPKGFVRLPAKKRAAHNRRLRKLAQDLIELREVLDSEERRINKTDLDAQRVESQETETIVLSKKDFAELVEVEDPTAAE